MPRLKAGDRFRVHGWVMLKDINDGEEFTVARVIPDHYDQPAYALRRKRCRKTTVVHYAHNIDRLLDERSPLNRIEVLP